MTASGCSPKFIGAKLGVASALALGSLPMVGAEALATPAITSDTLQIGTLTPVTLFEGSEPGSISQGPVQITETGQFITGSRTILLTEPGSTSISDIVTATISTVEDPSPFRLTVTLTSD